MKFKKIIFVCLFISTLFLTISCGVSYTIYFDSNGGSEVASITTDGKSTVSIPNNPTKEGYEFDGWYWDNNTYNNPFTANSLLDAPLSSDMTVYAKWTEEIIPIDNYLISANNFTVNGSELNIIVPNSTSSFSFINQLIFKENITFTVATDIEGNNIVSSKIIPLLPGDNVVYVLAKSNNDTVSVYNVTVRRKSLYTITFSDGIQPQTIEENNLIIEPENPTKTGYVFDKWLYGQADYNFDTPVTSDMNINANWIANINSLIFNGNGATSGSMENQLIETDNRQNLTANSYTKAGYTFIGWGTSSEGNVLYNNQANYIMGTESSYTLYAIWQANTNSIIFDGNGSTSGSMNKQLIDTDDTESLIPNAFIKNGYTFIGWSTKKDGAVEYTDQASYKMDTESSYTLYAVWQANTNTLIFNGNGSTSGSMENQSIDTNCNANLTANVFIKSGYTFLGWSNTKDGTVEYTDQVNYIMGTESSYILYAVWQANTNSIIFDGNGSTSGSMSNQNINTDATAILTANSYTKTGYTFIGWGTSSKGNVLYNNQASYTMGTESSYTLYAVWENSTFNYTISDNKITITGLKAQFAGDLIIPTQIEHRRNNFSVTSIGSSAFYGCSGLTGITIPDSVTSIGSSAFSGCSGLTEMALPFIGNTINGASNMYFGYIFGAASYIYNKNYVPSLLKTVIITKATNIADSAFYDCSGLTSVTIPESVTSIGSSAFYNCSVLTGITIPDSVTSIGERAFTGCSGLTSITVDSDNTVYSSNGNCLLKTSTKILILGCKNSIIPNDGSVTSIGNSAFAYCSDLTGITIPDSVTSIGSSAFFGCNGLTSITIGRDVISIGDDAFSICFKLIEIYNKSSLAITAGSGNYGYVGRYARNVYKTVGGSKLSTTEDGYILYTDYTGIILIGYIGSKNELDIPETVTEINQYAFLNCTDLISIAIPDSVTSIGSGAFSNCRGLTGITIPDSVTSIGSYAFEYCTNLTSVTIPDSIISIGSYAFEYCTNLTSVTIGNSITSIGNFAFYGCYKLVEVYNLTTLNIVKGSQDNGYLGYYALDIYISLNEASKLQSDSRGYLIYVNGAEKILIAYNGTETKLIVPDDITKINCYAFGGCRGLISVTIGNSVTSIGERTFYNCNGLTSITIPDSVTSIGDSAFYNCISLTSVTIGNSVTSIGNSAFYNCTGLTSVTIGNSVTSIGNSAFYNCTGLTSVTIGNSVASIGNYAFSGCTDLISITIGNSVASIGNYAFSGCTGLTSISFTDTINWYWTSNYTNFINKTNGYLINVTNWSSNATFFKSTFSSDYWYKK